MTTTAVREPPGRRKRPTSAAAAHPKLNKNNSAILKIVISFNGAFQPRAPTGDLRYLGGETRIVSVDRSVSLAGLRRKISDLSAAVPSSFVLKYQLGSTSAAADVGTVSGDDDLRRVIGVHDELQRSGKSARLWLFVCSNGVGSGRNETESERTVRKLGFVDESLRKTVLKNRFLAKQNEIDMEIGNTKKCEQFEIKLGNALNLGDVNFRVDKKLGQVLCNRVAKNVCDGCEAEQGLRNSGMMGGISDMNREDIVQWGANCNVVKNGLTCGDDFRAGNANRVEGFYGGESVWGGLSSSIRNHSFGVSDCRSQRCYPYYFRNQRSNAAEMGRGGSVRLSARKCYMGLRPQLSIAKQGVLVRVYHPNAWRNCAGFSQYAMEGRARMMNSSCVKDWSAIAVGNQKPSKQKGHTLLQQRNVVPEEHCLGDCEVTESLSPFVRTMDTQEHLENEACLKDVWKVANISGTNDYKLPNEEMATNHLDNPGNCCNDIQDSHSGTSLVNISLRNLSLSEETSHASSDVSSDVLLKLQAKATDLMDEGQFILGPQVKESNVVASDPSLQSSAKIEKGTDHVEEVQQHPPSSVSCNEEDNIGASVNCSKVIIGTSNDLTAFYTHLATRELQTIKDSDLELIKELGSGTYGTVYHGKWKGSNVAIKKIKPSCFQDGTLEDRLLADFWKEAHILGQLHHPNIVAFYGVVTDGPVTNLATVTEYMANGSLKQVLRRKDRTIDRRKRLIIAMDAAFGIEYLHEKSIVHFDLKSHNFLVNMRDPQRPVCKIGDLGLSKIKQRTLVSGGVRGTIPWMAPELLNSNSKNNLVTEKVDVYSFGIVMWELLTGDEPYENLRSEEIIAGIIQGSLRPEIPTWCDPTWRSLMERCWSSDPESRPPFSEIAKELRAMSAALNIK